jgi:hypothetical protein
VELVKCQISTGMGGAEPRQSVFGTRWTSITCGRLSGGLILTSNRKLTSLFLFIFSRNLLLINDQPNS